MGIRRSLRTITDQREPAVTKGFANSVEDLCDNARLALIVDALKRKDIDGAVAALGIEPAAFGPLYQSLKDSYVEGGQVAAAHFTKAL